MLKKLYIVWFLVWGFCWAGLGPSTIGKHENVPTKMFRNFTGTVTKVGFFKSLRSGYKYQLCMSDQRGAYLHANKNDRMSKILGNFINKKVVIKGSPSYVNTDPYLAISIEDISEQ